MNAPTATIVAALILAAALVWHAETGRYELEVTTTRAVTLLDTPTGELDICAPYQREGEIGFECSAERTARIERERKALLAETVLGLGAPTANGELSEEEKAWCKNTSTGPTWRKSWR